MRIVVVNKGSGLKIAGMGIYAQSLKVYLRAAGHEVFELQFSKKKSKDPAVVSIPYYYAEHRAMVLVPSLSSVSKIQSALRKIKPDIVYINFATSTLDFIMPKLCHQMGIPVAAVWHADYHSSSILYRMTFKLPFRAYMSACKQLDMMQVFSNRIKEYFVDKGIKNEHVAVIPNGVDIKVFSPGASQFAKKKKIQMGILFLGRMAGIKNPRLLIESFLKVDPPEGVKLVMVGDGDELGELKSDFKDKRIIFTGKIEDMKQKVDVIRACQVFVLPSKFEGMSLSLLEAMSSGLACIASDVGTNKEVLDGVGRVIPFQKLKKGLPQELERLINSPVEVARLGKLARQRIEDKYAEKKTFGLLEQTLEETIRKYKKPKNKQSSARKLLMRLVSSSGYESLRNKSYSGTSS